MVLKLVENKKGNPCKNALAERERETNASTNL